VCVFFLSILNLVYKNGQKYEINPCFDGFSSCLHLFSDMDPDPEPSSNGSGSGKSSGSLWIRIHNTDSDVKFLMNLENNFRIPKGLRLVLQKFILT
jgi:hypothetical protein